MRLSYALDLRYGVAADLAQKIWHNTPIDLATGHFNGIWQGDANDMILRSFDLTASPVAAFNLSSASIYSIRETALRLGQLLERKPRFIGVESGTAFVSNTTLITSKLGVPPTALNATLNWIAHWVRSGGRSLNRPTHFDVRDGQF